MSLIFPKKEILYAPMLGTLGGGSARGFGRGGGGAAFEILSGTFTETATELTLTSNSGSMVVNDISAFSSVRLMGGRGGITHGNNTRVYGGIVSFVMTANVDDRTLYWGVEGAGQGSGGGQWGGHCAWLGYDKGTDHLNHDLICVAAGGGGDGSWNYGGPADTSAGGVSNGNSHNPFVSGGRAEANDNGQASTPGTSTGPGGDLYASTNAGWLRGGSHTYGWGGGGGGAGAYGGGCGGDGSGSNAGGGSGGCSLLNSTYATNGTSGSAALGGNGNNGAPQVRFYFA